ncbi:MAG TPA: hypothetical protein VFN55_08010 [Solirubrobacteraceae bacterium]|nr:hypothetical protein [Solirubrobacteraceae bacterium]
MRLYVCYGTWTAGKPLHPHPCGEAHQALVKAGHRPQITRAYGLGLLPKGFNDLFPGRRAVREATGNSWVPLLVLDDGTTIQGSQKIIGWAHDHPAGAQAEAVARPPA